MEFRPIERLPQAFQQTVTAGEIQAMTHRAFGPDVVVHSAVELGWGTYNNTYRLDTGADRPVILRVAPSPDRQSGAEREFLRNEYASVPYFAPIAHLLPRTLAVDFTHDVVARDYLFQSMLPGVPAPEGLRAYPRPAWATFFRQLGAIARSVHDVRGERFGRVAGPTFGTWSEALIGSYDDVAADLDDLGLDARDVRRVADAARRHRAVLDDVTEPRLLHGDLWTVNVMVVPDASEPTICGVLDCDRTFWGDPEADWTIRMAGRRPGTERDAFWEAYGPLSTTSEAALRGLFYQARHIAALRLERHRLADAAGVTESYDELAEVLARLAA